MATIKITDKTMVKVLNNDTGSVGYTVEGVTRKFDRINAEKNISFGELRDLFNVAGGRELFEEDLLMIKDNRVREELSLRPLDKYIIDEAGIKQLFKSTPKELEDVLENCTDLILEKITQTALKLPLKDVDMINLIKSYSGVDVYNIIEDNKTSETETSVTTNKRKRTPKKV